MSYADEPTRDYEAEEMTVRRRPRGPENGSGTAARLDRLEKALHGIEQALSSLHDRLSPVLIPEAPSGIEGIATEEPRSELAARLDRMCSQAEAHRGFIRGLTERVDL